MSAPKISTCLLLMVLSLSAVSLDNRNSEIAKALHRPIRALTFPETSTMGIFFALSVPLEAPRNSVTLSYFFEAAYNLPVNSTSFEPWNERKKRKRRGIDRTTIYQTVENKFKRSGLKGRQCLLRAICETSEYPLQHNGVLGDIVRVIFTPATGLQRTYGGLTPKARKQTRQEFCWEFCQAQFFLHGPSTSKDETLPEDIIESERSGHRYNCSKYYSDCPLGLFDLIGTLM